METTIYNAEHAEAVTVMEIHGDVDAGQGGADRLCGLLRGLVGSGARYLVVDLAQTRHLVSEALGGILAALARVRLKGGDLVLAGAAGGVLAALNAVRVGDLTRLFDAREEAVAYLAGQAGESSE